MVSCCGTLEQCYLISEEKLTKNMFNPFRHNPNNYGIQGVGYYYWNNGAPPFNFHGQGQNAPSFGITTGDHQDTFAPSNVNGICRHGSNQQETSYLVGQIHRPPIDRVSLKSPVKFRQVHKKHSPDDLAPVVVELHWDESCSINCDLTHTTSIILVSSHSE